MRTSGAMERRRPSCTWKHEDRERRRKRSQGRGGAKELSFREGRPLARRGMGSPQWLEPVASHVGQTNLGCSRWLASDAAYAHAAKACLALGTMSGDESC